MAKDSFDTLISRDRNVVKREKVEMKKKTQNFMVYLPVEVHQALRLRQMKENNQRESHVSLSTIVIETLERELANELKLVQEINEN